MFDFLDVDIQIDLHEMARAENIGALMSVENFEYRLDEWKRGKVRVLFLSGLSGGGKTTYARVLAEQTGAKLRSLDGYFKGLMRSKYGQFNSEEYPQLVYSHGVKELLADNPDGQVIIEGAQVCWMNPDDLRDHAVMVVGTSFVTSTWRAILRDFSKEHWEEYGTISPRHHTTFNLKTFKSLKGVVERLQGEVRDEE